MKFFKSSLGLFTIAFLVLIITNVIVLIGVNLNRTGVPTSSVVLSERELRLPYYSNEENSGISLGVVFRVINKEYKNNYSYYKSPSWLDTESLKDLGFDVDRCINSKYPKTTIAKEIFVVLENDGQAYQKSLKLAQEYLIEKELSYNGNKNDKQLKNSYDKAKKRLYREKLSESRLFAIDAGLEYKNLRKRYNNNQKYLIVRGLVNIRYDKTKKTVSGYIQNLSIQQIHIPLIHKTPLDGLSNDIDKKPRYEVKLDYGSRYEPWVVSLSLVNLYE